MLQYDISTTPVTADMLILAQSAEWSTQEYICYWIAFNDIYTRVTLELMQRYALATLARDRDGHIKSRWEGTLKLTQYKNVITEREQIRKTIQHFDHSLRERLIRADETAWFVNRTPRWEGQEVEVDGWGQRLNGVINVGYTECRDFPIWQPIDKEHYRRFLAGDQTHIEDLTEQLIWVLYTVRNNLFHAGKVASDANDNEVVSNALMLLKIIVYSFIDSDHILNYLNEDYRRVMAP
jgi:hypothetical protein